MAAVTGDFFRAAGVFTTLATVFLVAYHALAGGVGTFFRFRSGHGESGCTPRPKPVRELD